MNARDAWDLVWRSLRDPAFNADVEACGLTALRASGWHLLMSRDLPLYGSVRLGHGDVVLAEDMARADYYRGRDPLAVLSTVRRHARQIPGLYALARRAALSA